MDLKKIFYLNVKTQNRNHIKKNRNTYYGTNELCYDQKYQDKKYTQYRITIYCVYNTIPKCFIIIYKIYIFFTTRLFVNVYDF